MSLINRESLLVKLSSEKMDPALEGEMTGG